MAKYTAEQLRQMLAKGQAMRNPAGDPSYPIADEEDLGNAIHAVGRGGANGDAIRRYIMGRAKALGKTAMIPDTWNTDGSLNTSARADEPPPEPEPELPYARTVAADDIRVRTESDGARTVEAYAAVFEKGYDVRDPDGDYTEILDRGVFNRALGLARQSSRAFPVLWNHGLTMHGTPDPDGSIPIGVAEEVTADRRGLFTRTRFHNTPRADAVLEGIEKGSITGYSFSGVFRKSDPPRSGSRYRGQTVRRLESTLREFGPALFPANPAAEIIGVRALEMAWLLAGHGYPGTPPEPDGPASPDGDQAESHSPRTPHEQVRAAYARFRLSQRS